MHINSSRTISSIWRRASPLRTVAQTATRSITSFSEVQPRTKSYRCHQGRPPLWWPGNDILTGGRESDYLEGGVGLDVYRFSNGDGVDTIVDGDGKAIFVRNGSGIALGIKQSGGVWVLGGTTYTQNGGDLEVSFIDQDDKVVFKDFDFTAAQTATGYAGIRLVDAIAVPATPQRTFIGDRENYDADPASGVQTRTDGFNNIVRADGQDGRPDFLQANRADVFFGSSADQVERFTTAGGDDVIWGDGPAGASSSTGGRDLIETGAGRDTVTAGAGNDWIEGGTEAGYLKR